MPRCSSRSETECTRTPVMLARSGSMAPRTKRASCECQPATTACAKKFKGACLVLCEYRAADSKRRPHACAQGGITPRIRDTATRLRTHRQVVQTFNVGRLFSV